MGLFTKETKETKSVEEIKQEQENANRIYATRIEKDKKCIELGDWLKKEFPAGKIIKHRLDGRSLLVLNTYLDSYYLTGGINTAAIYCQHYVDGVGYVSANYSIECFEHTLPKHLTE